MKQQTSVDWLVDQLKELAFIPEHHIGMGDIRITQGYLDELAEQAKQMEKEQIVNAYYQCGRDNFEHIKVINKSATEYYNETYGK